MEKVLLTFKKKDCMGCHACEVACKQEHELGVGPRLVRVIEKISDYIPITAITVQSHPVGRPVRWMRSPEMNKALS